MSQILAITEARLLSHSVTVQEVVEYPTLFGNKCIPIIFSHTIANAFIYILYIVESGAAAISHCWQTSVQLFITNGNKPMIIIVRSTLGILNPEKTSNTPVACVMCTSKAAIINHIHTQLQVVLCLSLLKKNKENESAATKAYLCFSILEAYNWMNV